MTATIPGTIGSTLDIPDLPDRARMYRDCGARLRDAMRDKGIAALVLLGNGNVVYATGVSWPLLDARVLIEPAVIGGGVGAADADEGRDGARSSVRR